MFKLFVTDTNVDSGTIPISWCVSKETLEALAKKGVENPQIVLCIVPEDHYWPTKEYRKVVPLKDLMTYVEFRYPGKNKIYGFISFKKPKTARRCYLSSSSGKYLESILNPDGDDWHDQYYRQYIDRVLEDLKEYNQHTISVNVPTGCFAPEPYAWESAWVNHHFYDKCVDQCHYRRRRIFAYTLQPIGMFFNLMIRILLLILSWLFGLRGLRHWKMVFKPLTYSIKEVAEKVSSGGTMFIRNTKTTRPSNNTYELWWLFKRGWTLIFIPIVVIPFIIIIVINFDLVATLKGVGVMFAAFVAAMIYISVLLYCIDKINTSHKSSIKKKVFWYTKEDEMCNLICDGTTKPMKVSNLPHRHRTIKLRLSELKSKVCKPFPG